MRVEPAAVACKFCGTLGAVVSTGGGGTGADASSLPICCRYALTAFTSEVLSVMFVCARTASASVAADPSCRYGALDHTSRSVGGSIPVNVALRRRPLPGCLIVPTLFNVAAPLAVKLVPAWHVPQPAFWNTVRPWIAAAVSE